MAQHAWDSTVVQVWCTVMQTAGEG
jgi:hypothetical protein